MIDLARARRIAVRAQALDGSARGTLDAVRRSGALQLDPTARVAPNHVLALWSRLGRYDEAELRRLIARRVLIEFDAFIYPIEDLPLQLAVRRLWLAGKTAWPVRVRSWLAANARFVRYILRELELRGPLSSDQLEDRAAVPWPPPPATPRSGWNTNRNKTMALEFLQGRGRILVSGRAGPKRLWDLAERVVPEIDRVDPRHVPHLIAERRVRTLGIVRAVRPAAFRASYGIRPDYTGVGESVAVAGIPGGWVARRDLLRDRELPDRLTLLSPFDRLIHDRVRARELFGFDFTMEIYVPRALRTYGFFVMPVLRGERVIGRIDPEVDRAAGTLRVNKVFPEDGQRIPDAALRRSLAGLASTLGVRFTAAKNRAGIA